MRPASRLRENGQRGFGISVSVQGADQPDAAGAEPGDVDTDFDGQVLTRERVLPLLVVNAPGEIIEVHDLFDNSGHQIVGDSHHLARDDRNQRVGIERAELGFEEMQTLVELQHELIWADCGDRGGSLTDALVGLG